MNLDVLNPQNYTPEKLTVEYFVMYLAVIWGYLCQRLTPCQSVKTVWCHRRDVEAGTEGCWGNLKLPDWKLTQNMLLNRTLSWQYLSSAGNREGLFLPQQHDLTQSREWWEQSQVGRWGRAKGRKVKLNSRPVRKILHHNEKGITHTKVSSERVAAYGGFYGLSWNYHCVSEVMDI